MALFRRFFYRKPPDRLLEISERVYVFDCCFSTDVLDEDEYRTYMNGIVAQLQDHYPDAAFMVFNFKERDRKSQLTDVLSQYGMTVMDYPQLYEGCPLLPLEMIHHFLRSSESWLSVEGQQNVLLVHCEKGGWPVLAFMLAGLLLYRKQYTGEHKTLEMVYKQAPKELLHLWTPLNPQPSQLRYLQYICRRNFRLDWPQSDTPLALDCVILRMLPLYNGGSGRGCRPVVRVYGQDPFSTASGRSSKLLFSTTKLNKHIRLYREEECELVKLDIHCRVQGDVVLECIHLEDDLMMEEIVFRIMFHTEFVRSNVLMLARDELDVLWDVKDQIPREFRAEVLFSDANSIPSIITTEALSEDNSETEAASPDEFFEAEEIFSSLVDGQDGKGESDNHTIQVNAQEDESDHEVNDESHHEVTWKDDLEQHAFQDCAPDEASNKHGHEVDPNSRLLRNGDIQLESGSVIADVASKSEPKSENAGTHDKSEEEENNKQSQEVPNVMKFIEKQGTQQKLAADNNKQKLDKGLSIVQKKQSVSSTKSATDVGTNKKSKQQDSSGHLARKAKPTAVSRWIPSNKGSYNDSMHVYYPPSRPKSAPAMLALKDSASGGKSKPQSLTAASACRGRGKRASCPSSLDLSPAQGALSPTLSDVQELSSEPTSTSHSPPKYTCFTTYNNSSGWQAESAPPPPPPPHLQSFSSESIVTALPSRITHPPPPPPSSQNENLTELLPSAPHPPSSSTLISTNTSLRTTPQGIPSPPVPPTARTSSSVQNVTKYQTLQPFLHLPHP
ncbi:formin-like protein 20 [Phtheirospermum japonicum]|uniref:Formin-like protein 20 n=1 Tax=Phtheirospermum japonicum TaxID=374723 RepID=A0A830CF76_9LAMI|nr:formin-like protein 20 [Phtheirospermum japonicum]